MHTNTHIVAFLCGFCPGWIGCYHGNCGLNTGCGWYILILCMIKLQQMNWYCSIIEVTYTVMILGLIISLYDFHLQLTNTLSFFFIYDLIITFAGRLSICAIFIYRNFNWLLSVASWEASTEAIRATHLDLWERHLTGLVGVIFEVWQCKRTLYAYELLAFVSFSALSVCSPDVEPAGICPHSATSINQVQHDGGGEPWPRLCSSHLTGVGAQAGKPSLSAAGFGHRLTVMLRQERNKFKPQCI